MLSIFVLVDWGGGEKLENPKGLVRGFFCNLLCLFNVIYSFRSDPYFRTKKFQKSDVYLFNW